MSKVAAYYHIVFCTKHREMVIPLQLKEDLYRFIWNIIQAENCSLIRIGGIQNHIHILVNLNPSVALATLVQKIKAKTSAWLKSDGRFPRFVGWGQGYFASTVSPEGRESVITYIKNQEEHHLRTPLDEEFTKLHLYAGLAIHPLDLT